MQAIAALITWIASSFTGWVAGTISAKIAASLSLIAVYTSIFGVLIAALMGLIGGIEMAVNDDLSRAMSWFVPDNTIACIGAGMSAWVVRATFEYHAAIIRLWSSAL
ncbi:DUF5455 family protein [Marinobacterium litorale]|uniref:DUF5455 family protein n=1 Tax=Marinobacterium litorale TaxID=404770 RepID=UPI000424CE83|nr:DUF5455 family protein [Marinobacterium litorale]